MSDPLYDSYLSTHLDPVQQKMAWSFIQQKFRHLYGPFLPRNRKAPILEIGCGKGDFLRFLMSEGHENFVGVDIGREQIAYCRENVTENVLLIEDLQAYLEGQESGFELIVMLDVLEHIPREELVAVGRKLHAALSAGGRLVVKTVNAANPVVGNMIFGSDLTHESLFSEISLRQWQRIVGFSSVEFLDDDLPRKGIRRLVRMSGRRIVHLFYRALYYLDYTRSPSVLTPTIVAVFVK